MGVPDAQYLGVSLRTVYAIIDEEGFPAYKIRRVIRIRKADVDDYLERCRIEPGSLWHHYNQSPARSDKDSNS